MASTLTRRPVPALVSLVALLALTALVWWRVMNRSDHDDTASSSTCPTTKSTPAITTSTLPAPASITVQVLNSTTRTGLAGKVRTVLIADGFVSPAAARNDSPKNTNKIALTAEIRYGTKGLSGAKLLRFYFPGSRMVKTRSTNATVVVSLGKRYKAVATKGSVAKALAGRKIGIASPAPKPTSTATSTATPTKSC